MTGREVDLWWPPRVPWLALTCLSALACEQIAVVGVARDDDGGSRQPVPMDAEPPADASDSAPRDANGEAPDGSEACPAPEIAMCNPVANTGCASDLSMRCAPDLTANTLAGYCTFVGPIEDGGLECFNSVVTESCPPSTTCHQNECRTLCFCDADCGEGECCSQRLGNQGFRLCDPC